MTSSELAALITAIGVSLAGIITAFAALRNANNSAAKIDDLRRQLDEEQERRTQNRQDIIAIGENLSDARNDNAKLALLINQLFNQYEQATGKRPMVDLEMLKHMRTLQYITGPLGPIDVGDHGELE